MTHTRGFSPEAALTFEPYAGAVIDRYRIPGLVVAASRDGTPVYVRSFGYADVERGVPTTPETVFGVASVTKSFTAASVMRLADAGALRVGDPIVQYLPEFRIPGGNTTQVKIHHLLTHTAGLPGLASRWYAFARSATRDPEGAKPPVRIDARPPIETYADLFTYLLEDDWTPLGPPGAQCSYSNEGYVMLGAIIERVSGRPFTRYVTEEIFEPAGLANTAFGPSDAVRPPTMSMPHIPRIRDGRTEVVTTSSWWYSDVWNPAGGICSTVEDLLRYLEIYRTGGLVGHERILSQHAVAEMLRPHIEVWPGCGYGYGLQILDDYRTGPLAEHGGGRRSIAAHVAFIPAQELAVAVLANLADVPVRLIAHAALNVMQDVAPDTPPQTFTQQEIPLHRCRAYLGEYRSTEGTVIRVQSGVTGVTVEVDGTTWPAQPVGDNAFVVRVRDGSVYTRFLLDPAGRAQAVAHGLRIIRRTPTHA